MEEVKLVGVFSWVYLAEAVLATSDLPFLYLSFQKA